MTTKEYIDNAAREQNPTSEEDLLQVSFVIKELNAYIDKTLELSTKGIEDRLDSLIGYFTVTLDDTYPVGLKILRARKFEEGRDKKPSFKLVQDLSYPSPMFASLGRCNKKNKSIFYGCTYVKDVEQTLDVAFAEVRALKYERVNILDAETKKEIKLRFIGIYNYISRDAKPYFLNNDKWKSYKEAYDYMKKIYTKELFMAYQLCDAFFADILRKKGTTRLYDVTSVLSGMYLDSGIADGLLYVSVEAEGHPVVALSTKSVDRKIEYKNVASYEITENYGYSKYKAVKLCQGKVVDDTIVW